MNGYKKIEPRADLKWSFKKAKQWIWIPASSVCFGLILMLLVTIGLVQGNKLGTVVALYSLMNISVLYIFFMGLSSSKIEEISEKNNQGIFQSGLGSLFVSLSFLGGWLMIFLPFLLVGEKINEVGAIKWGFLGAIILWFIHGGLACIQHYTLRLFLWRFGQGNIPLNYSRFLDYAAERILLHKVGRGYKFIHNYFQDYFAQI